MSLQKTYNAFRSEDTLHTSASALTDTDISSVTVPAEASTKSGLRQVGTNIDEDEDFREGGLRGWLCVAGAYSNSFGIYQDYYTRIYLTDVSSSAISWIGSVNSFVVIASGGLYAGALYDRGYFYYLLYGGSFLTSFSLFMLSLAKPNHIYQNFLAQAIGHGIGAGMMYVPSVAVLSLYFRRRRALVMTIVASGSSFGALIHPIMLNNLIHTRLGFSGATRISAAIISFCLLVACLLLRPRLPPPKVKPSMGSVLSSFYRNDLPYTAVSAGLFFFTTGFYFPLYYLQLDGIKHGLSDEFSFYAIVILNASNFIGRLVPGLLINALGTVNMVVASALSASAVIFGMIGLKSVTSVVLIAVSYGFMAGVFVTLQGPLIASITTDLSHLGTRLGVAYLFCAMGALIGPPIHGALLSDDFIWWKSAVFSGVCALIGTMCFASLYFTMRTGKT
ncbi:hypothetical protein D9613_001514 [Agrocybe pediades]|uniref:Major facilitator superfamily (MFS) profile domain-containing protein n=1 Tax=Agrocybe pediades TaxID=84607 RepID=A0A8H4R513_9AGAR|nr:hypothetical protein D9613_001514 [Agrocybe pediades]